MSDDALPTPSKAKRGRPAKTPAEKRKTRNAREARRRRDAGGRTAATSPFDVGYQRLDAAADQPALTIKRGVTPDTPTGTDLAPTHSDYPVALLTHWPVTLRTALTEQQKTSYLRERDSYATHNAVGFAPNSLRSMTSDVRHWLAYCLQTDTQALPVRGDDVIFFFKALIDAGYKRAPLTHMISTLTWVHARFDLPSPIATGGAKAAWKDLCRTKLTKKQHQATGLTDEHLLTLDDAVDPENPVHVRDLAITRLAYDLLARPSEIAVLLWEDVKPPATSNATVTIGRGKTDQEGVGKTLGISADTYAALQAWRAIALTSEPVEPIFHAIPRGLKAKHTGGCPKALGKHAVAIAMQRLARQAGLSDTYFTGHSGRVGAAQDLTADRYTLPEIMQLGRWKTPSMPARYAEHIDAERVAEKRFSKEKRGRH